MQIYYSSGLQAAAAPAPRAAQPSRSAVEKLFQKYVDPTEGCIMAEGVGSFCEDLDVGFPLNPIKFEQCTYVACNVLILSRLNASIRPHSMKF